jgi:hypothetical protein
MIHANDHFHTQPLPHRPFQIGGDHVRTAALSPDRRPILRLVSGMVDDDETDQPVTKELFAVLTLESEPVDLRL